MIFIGECGAIGLPKFKWLITNPLGIYSMSNLFANSTPASDGDTIEKVLYLTDR